MKRKMPQTHESITSRVHHSGELDIYITVGFFGPRGVNSFAARQPGEVFIKIGKEGSTLAGLFNIIGILISSSLQRNVPWDEIANKIQFCKFEPLNEHDESIIHSVVRTVDQILLDQGSNPKRGFA